MRSTSIHLRPVPVGRHSILLADGSTAFFDALDAALSPTYRALHAPNGAVALELARVLRPSLIITDITLRVLDGIELLRAVRRDSEIRGTPFIIWGTVYPPDEIEALARGSEPFLALEKPDDVNDVLPMITEQMKLNGNPWPAG